MRRCFFTGYKPLAIINYTSACKKQLWHYLRDLLVVGDTGRGGIKTGETINIGLHLLTLELWPDWCLAGPPSFSTTTILVLGSRCCSLSAVAIPTMPRPMISMSVELILFPQLAKTPWRYRIRGMQQWRISCGHCKGIQIFLAWRVRKNASVLR